MEEAAPPDRRSPLPDEPSGEGAPPPPPPPPKTSPAARSRLWLWAIGLVVSLLGIGAAWLMYRSYAAVHLRPTARVPRCVLLVARVLTRPPLASGSEAFSTPEGEVFLTPNENRAVSCLDQRVSRELAVKFAMAFAEPEPELRGLELLKTVRDLPPGPSGDRDASAAYFIASSALKGLPDLPETKAAAAELNQIHACRFATRTKCPTRPPIPIRVWAAGIPSGLGALACSFVFGLAGFRIARDRIRARRARRKSRESREAPSN